MKLKAWAVPTAFQVTVILYPNSVFDLSDHDWSFKWLMEFIYLQVTSIDKQLKVLLRDYLLHEDG